jgi:hypothetical protein
MFSEHLEIHGMRSLFLRTGTDSVLLKAFYGLTLTVNAKTKDRPSFAGCKGCQALS